MKLLTDRVSMKELKAALNDTPDELLENLHIMQQTCIDEPEEAIGLCWMVDESEFPKYNNLLKLPHGKVLLDFSKQIENDRKNLEASRTDSDLEETMSEEGM